MVPFREFTFEAYDADVQAKGFPPAVEAAGQRVAAADGLVLATPEYNFSMPGTLKNTIDWISRLRPMPFAGKSALLLSASTSFVGGLRGLWHVRQPLEGLNIFVHPEMYALPKAREAFAEDGTLTDHNTFVHTAVTSDKYVVFNDDRTCTCRLEYSADLCCCTYVNTHSNLRTRTDKCV